MTRDRCSDASAGRAEPLAGTASTVRSWLLLEHPGPWGRDAFVDGRHARDGFGPELAAVCRAAGVRPVLIRRIDRSDPARPRCFAIRSGPGRPRIERAELRSREDALALDLPALGRGERLGLDEHQAPLFLVCTHGRHDACCAERGLPLARALAAALAEPTWECSHIGGDRFAGNVIAFPHGLYFGRVRPEEAERVARAYLGGRLSLEHLRGRSCDPMPVQFADHELRLHLGLEGVDEVTLVHATASSGVVSATFETRVGRYRVGVEVARSAPAFLTCRSAAQASPLAYRVVSVAPAGS